ncbi:MULTISPECIES: acyl carrier protein [Amycolatopsis]|uniref:acyl carrier protein n=1 Tax=Amycolatopsis sp. cg13 TaxID=3238807 RepID=UPI0035258C57
MTGSDRPTLDQNTLKEILRAAAGEVGEEPDFLDTPFAECGYDSIVMLETAARIEREFKVSVPEETLAAESTPRSLISAVNNQLIAAG